MLLSRIAYVGCISFKNRRYIVFTIPDIGFELKMVCSSKASKIVKVKSFKKYLLTVDLDYSGKVVEEYIDIEYAMGMLGLSKKKYLKNIKEVRIKQDF